MRDLWTILTKDLRLRIRDGSVFIVGIVAPFVIAAALGFVFSGVTEPITLSVGVVGDDDDPLRTALVDGVLPALQDDGLVTDVELYADRDAAAAAVDDGTVDAAFVAVPGEAGPGGLVTLTSVDSPIEGGVAQSIGAGVVRRARVAEAVVATAAPAGVEPAVAIAAATDTPAVATVRLEQTGDTALDTTTGIAVGIGVFFVLFAVGLASTGLLEEKRDRTLDRLRATGVAAWSIVGAKAALALVIGIVSMSVLALGTTALLGADWGPPPLVLLVIVAATLAATGVVSVTASFARTPEGASNAQGVVGTVLGFLGGAFFPVATGGVLGILSAFTPHRWFLDGIEAVATEAPASDVLLPIAVLSVMGVATGAVAAWRFTRRLEA